MSAVCHVFFSFAAHEQQFLEAGPSSHKVILKVGMTPQGLEFSSLKTYFHHQHTKHVFGRWDGMGQDEMILNLEVFGWKQCGIGSSP